MNAHVDQVLAELTARLKPDEQERAAQFTRLFWSRTPFEDLQERTHVDDVGMSIANWKVFDKKPTGDLTVQVINPQHGRDGWQSSHTVVRIHAEDAPFVVDSVLMVLSHGRLVTHFLTNMVVSTQRSGDGGLLALGTGENKELFIYAEIDRVADDGLAELAASVRQTMEAVRSCVRDFDAMKAEARSWLAELDERSDDEGREAAAFMRWLLDNHFTFLGYRAFHYGDDRIEQVPDSALGILRDRPMSSVRLMSAQSDETRDFLLEPVTLSFSKSGTLSIVHRPAYPDYIGFRQIDENGRVVGEKGFLGLYTSRVYLEHPATIPVVRQKVSEVLARSDLDPNGFDGKVLAQVLATYPRDELMQIDVDTLYRHTMDITYIHERRRTRAFMRFDRYGLFVTCLIYLPRDLYDTTVRTRIQDLLTEAFAAEHADFQPFFSESILVRLHFTLRVPPGGAKTPVLAELEKQIVALTRDWVAELGATAVARFGETDGRLLAQRFGAGFPAGYRESYSPRTAVDDIEHMRRLSEETKLVTQLFRRPEDPDEWLRLKVYHRVVPLPLSDLIPALENMGLRVLGETLYLVQADVPVSVQDFQLRHDRAVDLGQVSVLFEDAFTQIWHNKVDDDGFNKLTFAAQLDWPEIDVLRAYARYNKQLRFGFSLPFVADTLANHPDAVALLVRLFHARFKPGAQEDSAVIDQEFANYLEGVTLLNEDRILRRFSELIHATLRTNFYQPDRRVLTLKVAPQRMVDIPQPAPMYEIFVSSAHVEGVHLRSGPIARGGLRWSDRLEDYRTEVLGLVKAQTVKNAVIVPQGAKGGFVVKRSLSGDPKADGVTGYKDFIRGLLSVTDNIDGGVVCQPEEVVPQDGEDPYLVVAADKGTATFSDVANEIAEERGFWLGDGFASGGTFGYDHKKMGITAKGAWISVQRHFAERGIDVQSQSVTVLGIGDMAGDVFGNGMLLSEHIQLVAAFNHRHIFVDPNPDAAASFAERRRLFEAVAGWDAYDATLISKGGGVFERQAKSIAISDQMRTRFDLTGDSIAPDALINALLRASVDLIWNGGIGTYVKAAEETDEAVGDRANDGLRVTADELRCQVFGEGGNLGLTQQARVAFALRQGAVNTDFIDNSAGVDCSDHEVNIKILLNELVSAGELAVKHRNDLLASMTSRVAALVLHNNRRQAQTLSLAQRHSRDRHDEYRRLLGRFERDMGLDRELESLPTDEGLVERFAQGGELTRPELAVLLAFAKMQIKEQLYGRAVLADPHLHFLLASAFPEELLERHPQAVSGHRLRDQIVATQAANDLVAHVGISFVMHLTELVGGTIEEIVRAYLISAAILELRSHWDEIDALGAAEEIKLEMLLECVRLTRRVARWVLRHRRNSESIDTVVAEFAESMLRLAEQRQTYMGTPARLRWQSQVDRWATAGVPRALAERTANAFEIGSLLPVLDAAQGFSLSDEAVASRFSEMGEQLRFAWVAEQLEALPTTSHWQAMERDSLLDEITTHQGRLAAMSLQGDTSLADWTTENGAFVEAWLRVADEAQQSSSQDFSMYAMTCRKLSDLCRSIER